MNKVDWDNLTVNGAKKFNGFVWKCNDLGFIVSSWSIDTYAMSILIASKHFTSLEINSRSFSSIFRTTAFPSFPHRNPRHRLRILRKIEQRIFSLSKDGSPLEARREEERLEEFICNLMSFGTATTTSSSASFCRRFSCRSLKKIFWLFAFSPMYSALLSSSSHNKATGKTMSKAWECRFIKQKSHPTSSSTNFSVFSAFFRPFRWQ